MREIKDVCKMTDNKMTCEFININKNNDAWIAKYTLNGKRFYPTIDKLKESEQGVFRFKIANDINKTGSKQFTYFREFDEFNTWYHSIPGNKTCYEVIDGIQKVYFDLDLNLKDVAFGTSQPITNMSIKQLITLGDTIRQALDKAVDEEVKENFGELIYQKLIYISHTDTKYSSHIIYPDLFHLNHHDALDFRNRVVMKMIKNNPQMNSILIKTVVDANVYTANRCFRLPGSSKIGKDNVKKLHIKCEMMKFNDVQRSNFELWSYYLFQKSLVSFVQVDSGRIIPSKIIKIHNYYEKENHSDTIRSRAIKVFERHSMYDQYKIINDDGEINLKRVKSGHCVIHNRTHDGNGGKLLIVNGFVKLLCFATEPQCAWIESISTQSKVIYEKESDDDGDGDEIFSGFLTNPISTIPNIPNIPNLALHTTIPIPKLALHTTIPISKRVIQKPIASIPITRSIPKRIVKSEVPIINTKSGDSVDDNVICALNSKLNETPIVNDNIEMKLTIAHPASSPLLPVNQNHRIPYKPFEPFYFYDFVCIYANSCFDEESYSDCLNKARDRMYVDLAKVIRFVTTTRGIVAYAKISAIQPFEEMPLQKKGYTGGGFGMSFIYPDPDPKKKGKKKCDSVGILVTALNDTSLISESVVCVPYHNDLGYKNTRHFNIFPGYIATYDPNMTLEEAKIICKPLLDHLKIVWAKNNEDHYQYIMEWFVTPIRDGNRTNIMLSIIGKMGTGKSFIFDEFMAKYVVGENICALVTGLDKITGHFNPILPGKQYVCIDETATMGSVQGLTHKQFEIMKSLVTANRILIEKKHVNALNVENTCSYICTSNNSQPVIVVDGDRRNAIFECADTYIGNHEYFDDLIDNKFPTMGNAFYFLARNWPKTVDLRKIPQTDARVTAMKESRPLGTLFFDSLFSGNIAIDSRLIRFRKYDLKKNPNIRIPYIKVGDIYKNLYEKWWNNEHNGQFWSSNKFAKELTNIKGITHYPDNRIDQRESYSYYSIDEPLYDLVHIGSGNIVQGDECVFSSVISLRAFLNEQFAPLPITI